MNIDRAECRIRPGHLAAEGSLTCDPCSSRVRDALDDIVRLYPKVAEEVLCGASSDDGPRGVGGGYRSGPPINLARIDREQRLAHAYIVEIVASWADEVREDTGMPPRPGPPALKAEATVLVGMWSWIRSQDWVGDLAAELFDLQRTLQQLAGETRGRIPLGICPQPVDHDPRTGAQIHCEQRLYARPDDRAVHCPQCSTTWPAYRWDELHQAQGAA
jgi:hypothetical protein